MGDFEECLIFYTLIIWRLWVNSDINKYHLQWGAKKQKKKWNANKRYKISNHHFQEHLCLIFYTLIIWRLWVNLTSINTIHGLPRFNHTIPKEWPYRKTQSHHHIEIQDYLIGKWLDARRTPIQSKQSRDPMWVGDEKLHLTLIVIIVLKFQIIFFLIKLYKILYS